MGCECSWFRGFICYVYPYNIPETKYCCHEDTVRSKHLMCNVLHLKKSSLTSTDVLVAIVIAGFSGGDTISLFICSKEFIPGHPADTWICKSTTTSDLTSQKWPTSNSCPTSLRPAWDVCSGWSYPWRSFFQRDVTCWFLELPANPEMTATLAWKCHVRMHKRKLKKELLASTQLEYCHTKHPQRFVNTHRTRQ